LLGRRLSAKTLDYLAIRMALRAVREGSPHGGELLETEESKVVQMRGGIYPAGYSPLSGAIL